MNITKLTVSQVETFFEKVVDKLCKCGRLKHALTRSSIKRKLGENNFAYRLKITVLSSFAVIRDAGSLSCKLVQNVMYKFKR